MKTLLRILICLVMQISALEIHNGGMELAGRILVSALATRYELASQQADSLRAQDPDAAIFFQNMVLLSRFDDLRNLEDLKRARTFLENAQLKEPFWDHLRHFQIGYAKVELHQTLSGALSTRKAAEGFRDLGGLEARGMVAIYDYYLAGSISWMPFRKDSRVQNLATLDSAARMSKLLWPLFTTSLAWIHFDRKEYTKGLALAERSLAKAPGNPIFLQMKGDMLFRLGRIQEAAQIYEKSLAEYSTRGPGTVRWWSAAGNLLRIYHALGDTAKVTYWQKEFARKDFEKVRPWMPPSLMDALEEKDLL